MKKILFLFAPLLLLVTSCKPDKLQEGEIEYAITYPNSEISGFMQAILPETMTITFKGTKMKTTIARGEIFTTEIISDEADRLIEMRLDFGASLLYANCNENEVQELISSQPEYKVKALGASDSLAGMYSTSYSIEGANDTITRSDAWFTEDLIMTDAYWFTPYADTKGTPVIYDAERYGMMMHIEAVKITKREVLDTEFDRDPELVEITFEDYEKEVQALFDLLME
tara:strand:- start:1027 stop:1707 length:681 start_codon:yes stop_codon:yes gene_type:complete